MGKKFELNIGSILAETTKGMYGASDEGGGSCKSSFHSLDIKINIFILFCAHLFVPLQPFAKEEPL